MVDAFEDLKFHRLSSAEHLKRAQDACGMSAGKFTKDCILPSEGERQLLEIPKSAKEWETASKILIRDQEVSLKEAMRENAAQAQTLSLAQMQKNIHGQAKDDFICATSKQEKPIMSFDQGRFWWTDDGRCATQLQKIRDADAEHSSYLSTTIRVDTDMDSFWLPAEERTCQTYPDNEGKVAVVACNETGSHRDHNIPVKFWGGVNRGTMSNWKCRREKDLLRDEFECRALN